MAASSPQPKPQRQPRVVGRAAVAARRAAACAAFPSLLMLQEHLVLDSSSRSKAEEYVRYGLRIALWAHQFMAEVLQHALPEGFKRIRYYGWMHLAAKKRLEQVKLLVGKPLVYEQQPAEPQESKPVQRCRKCRGEIGTKNLKRQGQRQALRTSTESAKAPLNPSQEGRVPKQNA